MSRVLPILFNTDMVRAILDDRKTTTRCCVKFLSGKNPKWTGYIRDELMLYNRRNEPCCQKPSYAVGDILYVRETWSWEPCWDCGMDTEEHNCCDKSAHRFFNHNKGEYGCYIYRASFEDNVYPSGSVWHPSIHMPKEAARIWLRVTDVRLEQLHSINVSGIIAEGISQWENMKWMEFEKIWNSTIKKSELDLYGWDANPWVWVIEFERCEKPQKL